MPAFPDYPPTVPAFLRDAVGRFGEREAVVLGDRRETYASLERASAELARELLAAGVSKASRVGLLFPNGPDWVVAWFAAARIGAITVPINTFYQARELSWTLRHADIDTLLCTRSLLRHDYLERLEEALPGLSSVGSPELRLAAAPCLRRVFVFGECDRAWARAASELAALAAAQPEIDAGFLEAVEANVTPADWLLIVYSSGSTATPKGAVHTQGTLIRHSYQLASLRETDPDARVWSPMPFFWVGGIVFSLMGVLHHGASMICQESFDPGATLELIERERVTNMSAWPHYTKAMLEHPDFGKRDLSSLGDGVPGANPPEPGSRVNSLGMTETCGPHTWGDMSVELPKHLWGSFGQSVPGVELEIRDPETGERVPEGEEGEIHVRGYSLMQGLYKQERQDVFTPDGFYPTGDGGHVSGGHLFFTGRLGEMIKTGGANVAPREVELLMLESPEILEAFVVGIPDEARGELVAAAVVLKGGQQLEAEELRTRLRQELAAYKVPRHVVFFAEGSLPFTDSGKIDKRRLAPLLAERIAAEVAA